MEPSHALPKAGWVKAKGCTDVPLCDRDGSQKFTENTVCLDLRMAKPIMLFDCVTVSIFKLWLQF